MFIKKPRHKKFDYQPRYYKPEKDEELKRKRKLGFRSNYREKTSTKKPYAYIIMLVIILYIFLKYNGYF
jgi:ribosomal protein L34